MAVKVLATVPLTSPPTSGSCAVDETFTMSEYYTLSGNGQAPTVILYWQFDQGSSTWIDIPTTGATGLVASGGSQANATVDTTYSRTITCKSAGAYVIRARGISSAPTTVDSVNQPTVTAVAIPAAPTNAHTDSKTDVQIVMHWTDNSNNETGFKMYKNDAYVETIAADSVSYTFTGLTASTQYDLAVKATNNGVDSAEAQLTETTSAEIGGTIFESQTSYNGGIPVYSGQIAQQTFTPQAWHYIYKVKLYLAKVSAPTGDVQVFIETDVGVEASSDVKAATAIITGVNTFTFDGTYILMPERVYTIKVTCTGGNSSNYIQVYIYSHAITDIYTRGALLDYTPYKDIYFVETGAETTNPGRMVWTSRDVPDGYNWDCVTFGNGIFVALSMQGNLAAVSSNGIDWTTYPINVGIDVPWSSMAYGNGVFVANTHHTTQEISYGGSLYTISSPDGINWTLNTMPAQKQWSASTFAHGLFVVICNLGEREVGVSPDGVNWSLGYFPEYDPNPTWNAIAWNETAGLFFASTLAYGVIAATSPNGIDWTTHNLPEELSSGAAAGGAGLFVDAAKNESRVFTSPDGITWTERALPVSGSWGSSVFGDSLGAGGDEGFVILESSSYTFVSSPDGITWTEEYVPIVGGWGHIAYGWGMYVAVANQACVTSGAIIPPVAVVYSFPWLGKFQLCHKVA